MMLIDSHANLHGEHYAEDLDATLDRAREAGVAGIVAICSRLSDFERVRAIAEANEDLWCTIGAHPHHAKDRPDVPPRDLIEAAAHPKVIAIGETGLDNYYGYSPEDQQLQSFRSHIAAARETGLPIIIHSRDADETMAAVLEEEHAAGPFGMLLHCYTSGRDLARRGAALGAYFSVNGIMAFKNAHDVRAVILEAMPEDRIMLETDCPYLAPPPHRGRRNEPAYLPLVAEKLADLKGWSLDETAERTTNAFFSLFTKAQRPVRARETHSA